MEFLIYIISIFALLIIVLSFLNIKLSIAVYIAYLILVPYFQLKIGGLSLSYNIVNLLLLLNFLYHYRIKQKINLNYTGVQPFIFLFLALLLLSVFSPVVPWGDQFFAWRATFMQTCILIFIIRNIAIKDYELIRYIKWSLIVSLAIAGIYGIFLTKLEGINPYTTYLSDYYGVKDIAEEFLQSETRLSFSSASKIQSTMNHPMTWGLNLSFAMILLTAFIFNEKKKWYWIIATLIGFNILISGVRTAIAALALGAGYFLLMNKNLKQLTYAIVFVLLSFLIISNNEDLSNLFASFTDVHDNKSDIKGSSISARYGQLKGCFVEIEGYKLAGKGYNWHGYYLINHGDHPVILAFESLIFIIICDSGIIGIFIWLLFFLFLIREQRKILKLQENIYLMDSIVIVYFAYSIGTGEYGYMSFFGIYYIFLIQYLHSVELNKQKLILNII